MTTISSYVLPLAESTSLTTSDPVGKIPPIDQGTNESILIFDPQGIFVGLLHPLTIFSKPEATTGSISGLPLIHPPIITGQTSPWEVMSHMLSLHVFSLPVFDDTTGNVRGIITAKEIVSQLVKDPALMRLLSDNMTVREPIILYDSAMVRDVYSILHKNGNNQVVIVSRTHTLVGMMTQRELYEAIGADASQNRSSSHNGRKNSPLLGSNRTKTLDKSVKTYMVTNTRTVDTKASWDVMLPELLSSDTYTLIVVDALNIPEGIITMRDVLLTLKKLEPEYQVPLMITDEQKLLSTGRRLEVEIAARTFGKKITKRLDVRQISVNLSPVQDNERHIKFYIVSLEVQLSHGKNIRSEKQGHMLLKTLKICERAIFSQMRKIR